MSFLDVITAGLLKGTGQALQVEYETGIESRRLSEEKQAERQQQILDSIKESQTKEQGLVVEGNFVVGSAALEAFSGQKRTMFGEAGEMFLNPNSNGYKAYKLGTDYASSKQSLNSIIDTQYTGPNGQKSSLFGDVLFRHVDSETGQIKPTAQPHDVKIYNTIRSGLITNLTAAQMDLRQKAVTQEGGKDIIPNLYKEFEPEINRMKSMGAPDAFIDDVFTSALGLTEKEQRFYFGRYQEGGNKISAINFGSAPTEQERNLADSISANSNPHENINQVSNEKIFEAQNIANNINSKNYTSVDVLNSASNISRLLVDGKIDYVTGDPRRNFKIIGGESVRKEVQNTLKPIMALPSVGDRISLVALAMPDDFLENKSAGRGTAYAQKTSVEFEKDIISGITGIEDIAKYQDTLTLRVKNFGTLTSRLNTIDTLLVGPDPAVPGVIGNIMLTIDAVSKTLEEATGLLNLITEDNKMSNTYQDSKKEFAQYETLEDFNEVLASKTTQIEKTRMLRYLLTETVFTIARTLENPEGKGARLSKSDIDAIIEATNFGANFTSAEQIMAVTKLLKKRMSYDLEEAEHLIKNFNAENIQAAKFLRRQSGKASDPTFMLNFDESDKDSQKAAFTDFLIDLQSDMIQKPVERDPVTGEPLTSNTPSQPKPKVNEIEQLQINSLNKKSGSAYGL